jgi:hypothetical protein
VIYLLPSKFSTTFSTCSGANEEMMLLASFNLNYDKVLFELLIELIDFDIKLNITGLITQFYEISPEITIHYPFLEDIP